MNASPPSNDEPVHFHLQKSWRHAGVLRTSRAAARRCKPASIFTTTTQLFCTSRVIDVLSPLKYLAPYRSVKGCHNVT